MQTARREPEIQFDPLLSTPPSTIKPLTLPLVESHPSETDLFRKSSEPIFQGGGDFNARTIAKYESLKIPH